MAARRVNFISDIFEDSFDEVIANLRKEEAVDYLMDHDDPEIFEQVFGISEQQLDDLLSHMLIPPIDSSNRPSTSNATVSYDTESSSSEAEWGIDEEELDEILQRVPTSNIRYETDSETSETDIEDTNDDIYVNVPTTHQFGGEQPRIELRHVEELPSIISRRLKRLTRRFRYIMNHNLHKYDINTLAVQSAVERIFNQLFERNLSDVPHNFVISGDIIHERLTGGSIYIPHSLKRNFNASNIHHAFASIMQSNSQFLSDGKFELILNVTDPSLEISDSGGHGRKRSLETGEEVASALHSIVTIKNNDHLCLPRALAVSKSFHELGLEGHSSHSNSQWKLLKDSRSPRQKKMAMELCIQAGVDPEKPCTLEDVRFQNSLSNYQIIVMEVSRSPGQRYKRLFCGPPAEKQL